MFAGSTHHCITLLRFEVLCGLNRHTTRALNLKKKSKYNMYTCVLHGVKECLW